MVQHRFILDAGADDRWFVCPFSLNRTPKSHAEVDSTETLQAVIHTGFRRRGWRCAGASLLSAQLFSWMSSVPADDQVTSLNGIGVSYSQLYVPSPLARDSSCNACWDLQFERVVCRCLPAMDLVRKTRNHRRVLSICIKVARFRWIVAQVVKVI